MRQPKKSPLSSMISLQTVSSKSHTIAELIKLAESRQSIDKLLDQCLPSLLQTQFMVSNFIENKLVLTCNSAKLMAKFGQIQDEILNKLNVLIYPRRVEFIQIKVRPSRLNTPIQSNKEPLRQISKKNAQILLEEAEHTSDQKLKKVLTNLAKHAT